MFHFLLSGSTFKSLLMRVTSWESGHAALFPEINKVDRIGNNKKITQSRGFPGVSCRETICPAILCRR